MAIDLNKVEQTTSVINLKKHADNLGNCIVNLKKTSGVDLDKHTARVCVVLDYSGSAAPFYDDQAGTGETEKRGLFGLGKSKGGSTMENSSEMQKVLTKLFPLALKFDDNGELEVWLFENNFRRFPAMTFDNYESYVKKIINSSSYDFGGTCYAPVLRDIEKKYFTEEPSADPVYVVFITDGDNSDKSQCDKLIRDLSRKNIFVQFIGIGHARFDYLQKLDDLSGRDCDNTGFEAFGQLSVAPDEEVYHKILRQYVAWLKVKA